MDVATVVMHPDEAREKLRALRKQLHRRADAEYLVLEKVYEHVVEGSAVFSLTDAFRAAPVDAAGRPRMAIARADRRQVKLNQEKWESRMTFDSDFGYKRGGRVADHQVVVPALEPHTWLTGYALVPIVPSEIVNQIRGQTNLRFFFTLWEVEEWSDKALEAVPDRDPYLVRRIDGDLFAVIAEWDLTEVERLVMAARRNG